VPIEEEEGGENGNVNKYDFLTAVNFWESQKLD
jgi:hypothetical protein